LILRIAVKPALDPIRAADRTIIGMIARIRPRYGVCTQAAEGREQ
jgi:hypothetical protein